MTSDWQPSQEGLTELVQLFRDSQSPQMDVQERIAQVRTSSIIASPYQMYHISLIMVPPSNSFPDHSVSTQ